MVMRRHVPSLNWRPRLFNRPLPRFNRAESSQARQASRIDRITAKLPHRLQKYTVGLRNAPVSHIVSFLILHEITAIVPLLGLFGLFHCTEYVPVSYMSEHFGSYVQEGVKRFEKYFKRKGWFGFGQDAGSPVSQFGVKDSGGQEAADVMERWQSGDGRYKVVVEVALAYAITKALLPLRIVGSVWATPWFAGILTRARGVFSRKT